MEEEQKEQGKKEDCKEEGEGEEGRGGVGRGGGVVEGIEKRGNMEGEKRQRWEGDSTL